MKKNVQLSLLLGEAVVCSVLAFLPTVGADIFSVVMAFPFAQAGDLLRSLSLSGAVGNGVAIALYLLLSLSPFLLFLRKNKKLHWEDALIPFLSPLLFWVLYLMINPGSIPLAGGFGDGMEVKKAVLGGAVYAVLFSYLMLRLLRRFYRSDGTKALHDLSALLFFLNAALVAGIFGNGVSSLLVTLRAIPEMNSALPALFPLNYTFSVLRFLVDNLPYALDILIIFSASALLKQLQVDRYADTAIAAATKLTRICGFSLILVLCSNTAFQLLQLLFSAQLFAVNGKLDIPIFSIALILTCLLFTRLLRENKTLKDENDSII